VRSLGFGEVSVLPEWESAGDERWTLTAVPARAPNARRQISLVLSLGGISVLHAGDTAVHPRFEEIRDRCAPLAGLLPVSGVSLLGVRLTMTPGEAARAAAVLDLRLAVPIHAEMRFDRLSALLYRARGTEEAFADAARRLAPSTRVLLAPRGAAVDLAPLLDEPSGLRYPESQ
jgi:L-ascorbate metabolism protein UlaG (beta-lactamase superfamily)